MEKTLLAILEEGAVKINSKPYSNAYPDPTSSNIFIARTSLDCKEYGTTEAVARSARKKTAQHLAAGKVLLKILETPYWDRFPFKLPSAEAAKEAVKVVMEELDDEGSTISANPVGNLQNICKQRGLPEPNYDFSECDGTTRIFVVKCGIPGYKQTASRANNKKQAKANAAKEMLTVIEGETFPRPVTPKEIEEPYKPYVAPEPTKAPLNIVKADVISTIEAILADPENYDCYAQLEEYKANGVLDSVFKKPVKIIEFTHNSFEPATKIRSFHVVDPVIFAETMRFNKLNTLYSFIGMGESDKIADNIAARNALIHIKRYYELHILD